MKPFFITLLTLLSVHICFSQEDSIPSVDNFYKEDQFYIGTTYNLLGKRPNGLKQSGFSSGIHFGMIKDMPLNSALGRDAWRHLKRSRKPTPTFTVTILEQSCLIG